MSDADDWISWLSVGGAVAAGSFIREIARMVQRLLGWRKDARKTDAEIFAAIRDALVYEMDRLRNRIKALEARADHLQAKLVECEERSAEVQENNAILRAHAAAIASRIDRIDDKIEGRKKSE